MEISVWYIYDLQLLTNEKDTIAIKCIKMGATNIAVKVCCTEKNIRNPIMHLRTSQKSKHLNISIQEHL